MRVEAWTAALGRRQVTRLEALAAALFALLSIQYLVAAVALARAAPWWMDEVLAVWTAATGDAAAIWSALVHGAEFNPPLYDLLLSLLRRAGATSHLALRLPSIVAGYAAAVMVGAMAWRRGGVPIAAVAAGAVLASGLFGYAVQARPYALVTAVFAAALLCHDRARAGPLSPARAVLLAGLLSLAVALHFYALLLVGALAAVELLQARLTARRVDRRVLIAAAIAGASILLWWPILTAARAYSGADVTAAGYYARPTLIALLDSYATLLGASTVPLIGLILANLRWRCAVPRDLAATCAVLLLVPLLVFTFALVVSHSFAERYVLAGVLGLGLLFALQLARLGRHVAVAAPLVLAALLATTFFRDSGELGKADRLEALAVARAAPGTLPIATGSGLRYLEIAANTPAAVARRLVFLDVPDTDAGDPTNRNQVLRWKAIRPALRVVDAADFLCRTPAFLLFAQPAGGGADALPQWLRGRVARLQPLRQGGTTLTLVQTRPCRR